MRIVVFAKGARGLAVARAIQKQHNLQAIVLSPGSGDPSIPYAQELDIPLHQPSKLHGVDFLGQLSSYSSDCFVLAGFNKIIRKKIWDMPRLGSINLHGGKIPEYRGCAPINWMLINGETEIGMTILQVDDSIDGGPILAEHRYPIGDQETASHLVEQSLLHFPPLTLEVLTQLESDGPFGRKQDPQSGNYFTRRYPEDGHLDFTTLNSKQAINMVRALVPPIYPGAYAHNLRRHTGSQNETELERIVITELRPNPENIRGVPGRVPFYRGEAAVVCTQDGSVLLTKVLDGSGQSVAAATALRRELGIRLV